MNNAIDRADKAPTKTTTHVVVTAAGDFAVKRPESATDEQWERMIARITTRFDQIVDQVRSER